MADDKLHWVSFYIFVFVKQYEFPSWKPQCPIYFIFNFLFLTSIWIGQLSDQLNPDHYPIGPQLENNPNRKVVKRDTKTKE